ncbi:MAG: nickel-dependent hydrogenase large subunit [Candidatus Omnitrophica bacterium]|nr:nickel-dependent hydrogenase large subunit [Candidatus Omnitrophota bacterium]MDD5352506.1 nickel-dependent hydrogenase large subunit [Candidatus Omnitrophota bacterium]MDD5550104.1 nickel-dependent hydrogenase large subunit [Candidatus Omnitrophota bacterium]
MAKTIIPIGPYHPLQEEPEFFQLVVEGEKIVDAIANIGYNHRGIEKLSELKTFDQVAFVVERICGICSTSHPLAYVRAVEDILGNDCVVPERANYIRTIIAELERIHSHLLWIGLAGHFLGYNTVYMWAWKERETVLDIFEELSGNRNNYAMMRVGGVRRDFEEKSLAGVITRLNKLIDFVQMIKKAVLDDPVLHARLKGVGVLTKQDCIDYCALGPTARASGIANDVRKDDPYAAYDKVKWNVITQIEGDVFAKAVVRILETLESINIVIECMQKMPKGPIYDNVKDIPCGEGIGHIEAPRGECFHYVRSDGTNRPVRHKVRAPTYMNLPTYKEALIGETISDATIILAAIDPCYCCTERVTVIDANNKKNKTVYSQQDLIKLSQRKTEQIRAKLGAR